MADQKFEIQIVTTANTEGARQTEEALNNTAQQTKEGGKKAEESSKQMGMLGLKTEQLKKLTEDLGREFPIAGMAARAMLNPVMAAFTGAIAIFGTAKKALADWNAELDAAGEAAAKPVRAHRDLAAEADATAQAYEGLARKFRDTKTESDKLKTALDDQVEALRTLQETQAAVDNAQKAKEIAGIHLAMKQREKDPRNQAGISAEEGAQRLAAVEAKYEDLARKRKEQNAQAELDLQKKGLAEQLAAKARAAQALQEATDKEEQAKSKAAHVASGKDTFSRPGVGLPSAAEKAASDAFDKAEKEAEDLRTSAKEVGGSYSIRKGKWQSGKDKEKEADEIMAAARLRVSQARIESDRYQSKSAAAAAGERQAGAEKAAASQAYDAAASGVDQYQKQIASGTAKLGGIKRENDMVAPIVAETRQLEAEARGTNVRGNAEARGTNVRGNAAGEVARSPLVEISGRMPNAQASHDNAVAGNLEKLLNVYQNGQIKQAELARRLAAIEQQMKHVSVTVR